MIRKGNCFRLEYKQVCKNSVFTYLCNFLSLLLDEIAQQYQIRWQIGLCQIDVVVTWEEQVLKCEYRKVRELYRKSFFQLSGDYLY